MCYNVQNNVKIHRIAGIFLIIINNRDEFQGNFKVWFCGIIQEDLMRVSDKNIDRIYVNRANRGADYKMTDNHYHNYYELYYVRHGKVRLCVDNSSIYDAGR